MKFGKIVVLGLVFINTMSAHALTLTAQGTHMLTCNDPGAFSGVNVYLNESVFVPNSHMKQAVSANVYFNFSSAQNMTCDGYSQDENYDIACIGYYHPREPTEVFIKTENQKIVAHWKTSIVYGHKDMTSVCTLSVLNP
jgi:hypothetical protein